MNRLLQKDDSPQSFVSNFSVIFHDYMRQSNTGHCVKKHYKKTKKKNFTWYGFWYKENNKKYNFNNSGVRIFRFNKEKNTKFEVEV